MNNNEELGEFFDLTAEFETIVKPIVGQLVDACAQLGMPVSVTVITLGKGTDSDDESGTNGTAFTAVNATAGTFLRMPIELLVGVRMLSQPLGEMMDDSYRRHLAYVMSGKEGMNEEERADFRMAVARTICHNAIDDAGRRIDHDVTIARNILSVYGNPYNAQHVFGFSGE